VFVREIYKFLSFILYPLYEGSLV